VEQAILQGEVDKALQQFEQLLKPDSRDWAKALILRLQAILRGSRDPALADDPALRYDDAAELLLMLEKVGAAAGERGDGARG
jgi:hypothetical protein